MITIRYKPARTATMNAIAQRFADFCSTQTGLRCAARVNFHKHAPGAFSLVREHEEKVGPASIINRLSKHPARESFNAEILDCDQSVLIDDLARFLVVKVAALIAYVVVKSRKQQGRFTSAIRSFLSTCDTALQTSEFCLCGAEPARVFDRGSIAQSRESRKAQIYADQVSAKGQRRCLAFDAEQSEPSSSFALDRKTLDCPLKRSVQLNPDVADLREPQSATSKRVTDLAKCHAVVAPHRSKAGIAGGLSRSCATEEGFERKVYTLQHVSQCLSINIGDILTRRSNVPHLTVLIEPRYRFTLSRPRITSFLKSSVVEFTANGEMIIQIPFLAAGRIKPIAVGLNHVIILPRAIRRSIELREALAQRKEGEQS